MQIEGRNAINELLLSNKDINNVYVQKDLNDVNSLKLISFIRSKKIKISFVDKSVINAKSISHRSQGFIAYVYDYAYYDIQQIINDCNNNDNNIVLILNEITDINNFGNIIRTCDCFNVKGIIIGLNRCASVNDTVIRISTGATNHIKISRVVNINNAIKTLKDNGFWIYGIEQGGENIANCTWDKKTAIIIGGEDSGIKKETRKQCDYILTIPMYGHINSFNASVACGIALYEASTKLYIKK